MNNNDRMNVRTLSEKITEQTGPMAALQKARLASQLAATLKSAALDAPIVSIYNNPAGTGTPPDRGQGNKMETKQKLMARYAKAEMTAYVARLGDQRQAAIATQFAVEAQESTFARNEKTQPAGHALDLLRMEAEDAEKAAATETAKVLKSAPPSTGTGNLMELDALIDAAVATFNAQEPRPKFGNRPDLKQDHTLPDGQKLIITITSFNRGGWQYKDWTHKTQLKLNDKVASKDAVKKAIAGDTPLSPAGQALLAAFEAQAPVVAADFIAFVKYYFEHITKRFGSVPAHPRASDTGADGKPLYNDSDIRIILETLAPVCDHVRNPGDRTGRKDTLTLNEAKLAADAKDYGDRVCVQWFGKTMEKLGDVESAELLADKGGDVSITAMRAGRKVFMRQQRILKWSTKGRPFNQFPALLYLDDKFVTEDAYKAVFK